MRLSLRARDGWQSIPARFQGLSAITIVCLLIVTLTQTRAPRASGAEPSTTRPAGEAKVVARVLGKPIYLYDLEDEYSKRKLEELRGEPGSGLCESAPAIPSE